MESKQSSRTNQVYIAVAAASALALGVYVYHLTATANRLDKTSALGGFVKWSATQEDKEKIARSWMEKYVRTVLLKSHSSKTPKPDTDSASLQSLIATEKGLLKTEDFEHL